MKILLEICVDTIESAVAAIEGGADRIELCSALSEGGLTPTVGLLRTVKRFLAEWSTNAGRTVPVYCMIRCRRGSDFQYSGQDMEVMLCDVKLLRENGADGFVFGALDETGRVHRAQCEQVVQAANETDARPLTFHRAIDCTDKNKLRENLALIAALGFSTILSSGLQPSAMEGMETIAEMKSIANDIEKDTGVELEIMPGSGVSASNLRTLLSATRCLAVHGSASVSKPTGHLPNGTISMGSTNVDALPLKVCSKDKVIEWRQVIDGIQKTC